MRYFGYVATFLLGVLLAYGVWGASNGRPVSGIEVPENLKGDPSKHWDRRGDPLAFNYQPGRFYYVDEDGLYDFDALSNVTFSSPVFITNSGSTRILEAGLVSQQSLPHINLNYAIYSQEFAENYNYPADNIRDMDAGVHAQFVSIETVRGGVTCRVGVLLDKGLDVRVPPWDYNHHIAWADGTLIGFPQPIYTPLNRNINILPRERFGFPQTDEAEAFVRSAETGAKARYAPYILQNHFYSTTDGEGRGSVTSAVITNFSSRYFLEYNYLRFAIGCKDLAYAAQHKQYFRIWLLQAGFDGPFKYIKPTSSSHLTRDLSPELLQRLDPRVARLILSERYISHFRAHLSTLIDSTKLRTEGRR